MGGKMTDMETAHIDLLNYAGYMFLMMLTLGTMGIIMSSLRTARAGYKNYAIKTVAKLVLFIPIVSALSWMSFNYDLVNKWINDHIHINPIIAILLCIVTYGLIVGAIFGLIINNFAKALAQELKALR